MLVRSGDLIPVMDSAARIPWTKRKSHVLNYLHRGPVNFQTYVYDTNVGDVAPLSFYFNPKRWSVADLNNKFGIQPQDNRPGDDVPSGADSDGSPGDKDSKVSSLVPKLLIYPERVLAEHDKGPRAPPPWVVLPKEFLPSGASGIKRPRLSQVESSLSPGTEATSPLRSLSPPSSPTSLSGCSTASFSSGPSAIFRCTSSSVIAPPRAHRTTTPRATSAEIELNASSYEELDLSRHRSTVLLSLSNLCWPSGTALLTDKLNQDDSDVSNMSQLETLV